MRTETRDRQRLRRLTLLILEETALESGQPIPDRFVSTPIEDPAHPVVATPAYQQLRKWFENTQGKGRFRAQRWLDDEIAQVGSRVAALRALAAANAADETATQGANAPEGEA